MNKSIYLTKEAENIIKEKAIAEQCTFNKAINLIILSYKQEKDLREFYTLIKDNMVKLHSTTKADLGTITTKLDSIEALIQVGRTQEF